MVYTNEEYLEMLFAYGMAQRNGRQAARVYAALFPNARHPSHRVILGVVERVLQTGQVKPRSGQIGIRTVTDEAHEVAVVAHVELNPHASTRGIAGDTGISQSSVSRILNRLHYHPYHVYVSQHLHDQDPEKRLAFCTWVLNTLDVDPHFLERICTTDEANFNRDGVVNRHNSHYWATENPHWVRPGRFQVRFSVNVWCGILGNRVLGPVFLDHALNGPRFLDFLSRQFTEFMDDLPLAVIPTMWFQLDGAPPHFSLPVREWLHDHFPGRWIGRDGPVAWPPRSPDLAPLDFFLWGYLKERVYETPVHTPDDLRARIRTVCASVTPDMLNAVRNNWRKRFQLCVRANGGLIEHSLT